MTPQLAAAGIYAALNSLIIYWLVYETGNLRRKHKVSIGDGGVKHITRILRGTSNALENIPMFLIMLTIAALSGAPAIAIHALGLPFTIFRAIHAWHFIQEDAPGWQRGAGFGIPVIVSALLALGLIGHGVIAMAG